MTSGLQPLPRSRADSPGPDDPTGSFVAEHPFAAIPREVVEHAELALVDLTGCLLAGSTTAAARIARRWALESGHGQPVGIWPGPDRAVLSSAIFANATSANALDLDDGYRLVKGHPGACVIPAALAAAEARPDATGKELVAAIVVGYEVAIRAGRVLHGLYSDYHCSGSWGALGTAAAITRLAGTDPATVTRALDVAEYHAPIGMMMRCIDHPAMVKDGIAMGALAGAHAASLAELGFDGPPHLLHPKAPLSADADLERSSLPRLGREYLLLDLYFKPHASCRWAQPAIDAVLALRRQKRLRSSDIEQITVHTFHEATRLGVRHPRTTEEAQYSLPWPVASAVVHGRVSPAEVDEQALTHEPTKALADRVRLVEESSLNATFPRTASAWVEIRLNDGRSCVSDLHHGRGEPGDPLPREEIHAKFRSLATPVIGTERARRLLDLMTNAHALPSLEPMWALLGETSPA